MSGGTKQSLSHYLFFFFSSRRRHTRFDCDWSSDVCSSDLSCPTYCLMPDHVHIVWMGLWLKTDQREAMAFFRTYLAKLIAPAKFQPQAHEIGRASCRERV